MLCRIVCGWLYGNISLCGNHLLYIISFGSFHWQGNVVKIFLCFIFIFGFFFFVVYYFVYGTSSEVVFMCNGGARCGGCRGVGGCRGYSRCNVIFVGDVFFF